MTDLVVQAPALTVDIVQPLVAMAGARSISETGDGGAKAFRLADIQRREGVAAWCAAARIDHAFVPPELRRADLRALAIDMDSTLITIECIDEIADLAGVRREVAAITERAMAGEIDFSESLVQRVALLENLPVTALLRVYAERVVLSPGAEALIAGCRAVGARTVLVSGGFTFFTERLRTRLDMDESFANTLEIDAGRLTGRVLPPIVDAQAKATHLRELRRRLAGNTGVIVAVGDGANDLPMLAAADISIAYHAKPVVRANADYSIDFCGLDAILNLFRSDDSRRGDA